MSGQESQESHSAAVTRGLKAARYAGVALVLAGSAMVGTALDEGFGWKNKKAALVIGGGAYMVGWMCLGVGIAMGERRSALRAGLVGSGALAACAAYMAGTWTRVNELQVPMAVQIAFAVGWLCLATGTALDPDKIIITKLLGGFAAAGMAVASNLIVLPWERRNGESLNNLFFLSRCCLSVCAMKMCYFTERPCARSEPQRTAAPVQRSR
jgi:uncharacterized membrane protein YhhN